MKIGANFDEKCRKIAIFAEIIVKMRKRLTNNGIFIEILRSERCEGLQIL